VWLVGEQGGQVRVKRGEGKEWRERKKHTSISLRASVLVTAMVSVVVYATATFGMEMMINVQDGGLAAARETAFAESASDDKFFPSVALLRN